MILSVINNKGGVGKTTTAVNLAAAWARSGSATLLVDLDAQCSASLHLGVRRAPSDVSAAFADRPLDPVPTSVAGLHLLPGSSELRQLDQQLAGDSRREQRLTLALQPLRERYRRIVLDCPPALSLVTANALAASQGMLIPVTPQYLAMEGLANLLRFAQDTRLLGIVLTMVDARTRVTGEIIQLLRERFGTDVLRTEIKNNVRLSEAASFGQSIWEYDARCPGARLYAQLKDEVEERCRVPVA